MVHFNCTARPYIIRQNIKIGNACLINCLLTKRFVTNRITEHLNRPSNPQKQAWYALIGVIHSSLAEKIGQMNVAEFDKNKLADNYVSEEQPNIIDDPTIKSGFYTPQSSAPFSLKKIFYIVFPILFAAQKA